MGVIPGHKHTEVGTLPEDWDVGLLGDLVDPTRTIRYGIVQPGKFDPKGRYMVRGQDYSKGWVEPSELFKVSAAIEEPFAKARVRAGDVLMTIVGASTGRIAVVPPWLDDANLTQTTARIAPRSERLDGGYCSYVLAGPVGTRQVSNYLKGAAQPGLNCGDIEKFLIPLPPVREQKAIATALGDVDALLVALDRLIAKKRDLKQAAMQQLLTGQTRLPGFSGKWETKRLGDLAVMSSGGTPPSGDPRYYDGDVPWVSISDMTKAGKFIRSTERNLTRAGLENSAATIYPAGTVLYAMYASIGECCIAVIPASSSQAILGIRPGRDLSSEYLYYWMCAQKAAVKKLGQHGTQANLNAGMVRAFELPVPALSEQAAVAGVLSDMDTELTALEQRRDKTRLLKQGMMQELLTGRTRLV